MTSVFDASCQEGALLKAGPAGGCLVHCSCVLLFLSQNATCMTHAMLQHPHAEE